MKEEHIRWIDEHMEEADNCTKFLDELSDAVNEQFNVRYTVQQLSAALLRDGLTTKQLNLVPAEQDPAERERFRRLLGQFQSHQLLFFDESHIDWKRGCRQRGRSQEGTPAIVRRFDTLGHTGSSTLKAVLSIRGIVASEVLKETVDAEDFISFFIRRVLPQCEPFPGVCSVIVFDGAEPHLHTMIEAAIREHQRGVLFVPMSAYSPDLNPIENCFFISKSRVVRRSRGMRGVDVGGQFELVIHNAITPEIACSLFRHAGIEVTAAEEEWATS